MGSFLNILFNFSRSSAEIPDSLGDRSLLSFQKPRAPGAIRMFQSMVSKRERRLCKPLGGATSVLKAMETQTQPLKEPKQKTMETGGF